jgi:hypothetical protein
MKLISPLCEQVHSSCRIERRRRMMKWWPVRIFALCDLVFCSHNILFLRSVFHGGSPRFLGAILRHPRASGNSCSPRTTSAQHSCQIVAQRLEVAVSPPLTKKKLCAMMEVSDRFFCTAIVHPQHTGEFAASGCMEANFAGAFHVVGNHVHTQRTLLCTLN